MDSLERLQGLHADLVAFTEKRLATLDRLLFELESTLDDFRNLLDKPEPSEKDKELYRSGKVVLGDATDATEFGINDEFKHISVALGTAIDLNEIETAKIIVRDYGDTVGPNLTFIAKAVADYQDRRDLLLQSLRLVLQHAEDLELDSALRLDGFEKIVKEVLQTTVKPDNGSLYISKCLAGLQMLEDRYNAVNNQLQNKETVGQLAGPEYDAILEFQKGSLLKQHEALSCILAYLFKPEPGYSSINDLHKLHATTQRWQKLDILLVHYLPAYSAAFRKYGQVDYVSEPGPAQTLNGIFGALPKPDRAATALDPFHAVLRACWTVQYSSLFGPGREHEPDAKRCPEQLKYALKEHALSFLLAISLTITNNAWRPPARNELVLHLLSNSPEFSLDGEQTSEYFRIMMMESLESFTEAWISNMPDSIRQLKTEEDELRLEQIATMQQGIRPDPKSDRPLPMHMEALLLLISFAFENRPDAAEQWWEDQESTLYGFLLWASKRQTVPRVSAFCEMLCSIAEGADGAAAAHTFLLEESVPTSLSRSRRVPSMNFAQMFAELELYALKVHERTTTSNLANRKILPTDMNETETPIMLSSYLRLIAHLCRHSPVTRQFVLQHSVDFPRVLLLLSSGPVPSYLKASIFATLDAMLTDKDWHRGAAMWVKIDEWASNGSELVKSATTKTDATPASTIAALQNTLATIASSIDQYDAFVSLLRTLLIPVQGHSLPTFPQDLGSTYRSAGIVPYIDFLCGQILTKRLGEVSETPQALLCTFHCLDAIAIGLESFDQNRAALLNRGLAKTASTEIVTYMQRHPFARLMQWVLSTEMDKPLMRIFKSSQQDVTGAFSESPLVQSIQRTVDVINQALTSQATYLDVVKPLLKETPYERSLVGQASMEEHVLAHPEIILDLCQYAASDHLDLSLKALSLLQKLSSSAKLNNHFMAQHTFHDRSRRIVDLLGPNAIATLMNVSELLAVKLQVDERELEGAFEAPGYLYKDGVIAFLNACLETQPELANIAHILLGFRRLGERLTVADAFENGMSLFDGLIALVRDYPHGDETGFVSWLIHLKSAGMQVLRQLWSSPVSTEITISQLRRYQLLKTLIASQEVISESSHWDGKLMFDPEYWFSRSGDALTELLDFRGALYLYTSQEIRTASSENLATVMKQHLQTMLGSDIAGMPLGHANLFDLADFLELDLSFDIVVPETQYFGMLDATGFMTEATDDKPSLHDVSLIKEALQGDKDELLKRQGQPTSSAPIDEEQLRFESEMIAAHLEAKNRLLLARQAWRTTLRSYVDMVVAIIDCCPMEASAKTQFILQVLQLILPKLDALVAQESEDTIELARIADSLLFALSSISTSEQERLDNIITEKLFQLFRASVDGILMATGAPGQRSILYSICTQYLNRITSADTANNDTNRKARANSMDCIRSSNMRLINILSDDAEDGADSSRLNALNLLSLLVSLARSEKSSYVLDSLVNANVLEIIIDPIKHIAADFQDTEPSLRYHLLTLHQSRMLLLLHISLTRVGAAALLDAGLIPAIRDSLLFRADPDLGFSAPASASGTNMSSFNQSLNPRQARNATALSQQATTTMASQSALQNYYQLLAPTLRVLLSVFTSRGSQNEQAVFLARSFLTDYRANMVGVFKKWRGVSGKVNRGGERVLGECVWGYTGLVAMSGWREWEDGEMGGDMGGIEGVGMSASGNGMGSVRAGKGYGFS
ncbi:uncharacterized protein HMPREF1541_04220 [Cyphellophora europaea CBS 101466]|uniref:Uncharacterized protein n=1 Tax=Cyphellophora europaea (strain CBS 101466) TaxID=1220924 RepID=W2S2T7_CYPE1|nr:uncharacterized protein HMPREF1541_04220 [Cyphellophora europaea CBS 101466]ETN42279.1 hypothetical protein HMPREF1541_04220 [Cyphellophora europaea CBS 101466]